MADTAAAPAPAPVRPTRPDEALYKESLAKADKDLEQATAQLTAVRKKIDLISPNSDSQNSTVKRRKEIEAQINEIKSKQGAGKNSRQEKLSEADRLMEQLKAKEKSLYTDVGRPFQKLCEARGLNGLGEHKTKVFKDELAKASQILEAKAETSSLRLVELKEVTASLSQLRGLENLFNKNQKAIDDLRAKIKELKDSANNPEAKALSEKYTELQKERDVIRAEELEASKGKDALYDELRRLQKEERQKKSAKWQLKDEYRQQLNAFRDYDREQKQKAWERQQSERDRIAKERKLERAQKMLADASDPAYLDEIRRANSLLQYYDPSFVAEKTPLQPSTNLQAQAERKVDASELKGVKVLSKKDRDEELFPATQKKKGKKGKKTNASGAKSTFNCPPSVLEDCSYLDIDPPMSAEDVPAVIEKVKAKLDHWKADQAAQTQKNIEKAKREIEKIEAEEAKENGGKKSSSGTATPNGNGAVSNGDKTEASASEEKTDEKVEDVTKEVEKTSIEDKGEEAAA